jgi:hypothetical protein
VTRRRRLLATAILLAILGGQAAAILLDRELWPFSPYPMFSESMTGEMSQLWLFGVLADGTEAPLGNREAFHPFRLAQLLGALERMSAGERAEALRDMLARREARRLEGHDVGPQLAAMRLYRMTWASDDPDAKPERELLAEARAE